MYVAIIADNPADRKQLERLMDRTNDTLRGQIGDLYIDSFGSAQTVLAAPMKFGLFLLDMTQNLELPLYILEALQEKHVTGALAVCRDIGTVHVCEGKVDNLLIIDKPVSQENLNQLVLNAYHMQEETATPKIEIRGKEKTYYVEPEEIIYAEGGTIAVYVYLTNGSVLQTASQFDPFCHNVLNHPDFVVFKKNIIINKNHVTTMDKKSVTMDTGMIFTLPMFASNPLL